MNESAYELKLVCTETWAISAANNVALILKTIFIVGFCVCLCVLIGGVFLTGTLVGYLPIPRHMICFSVDTRRALKSNSPQTLRWLICGRPLNLISFSIKLSILMSRRRCRVRRSRFRIFVFQLRKHHPYIISMSLIPMKCVRYFCQNNLIYSNEKKRVSTHLRYF